MILRLLGVLLIPTGILFSKALADVPPKTPTKNISTPSSFSGVVEKLMPAVVNISTTTEIVPEKRKNDFPGGQGTTPFEEFFRHFMEEYQSRPRKSSSLGSGFIISQEGETVYVVTCQHIIAGADEIKIMTNDGKEFKAEVRGKNERTDLAVLKFQTKTPMTTLSWGKMDDSKVGDWVIAVGNPFGFGSTVTAGIISAKSRDIHARSPEASARIVDGYIQTDASINMGNSGGPMVDMRGDVIGINTAIFSPNGGNIGLGFAIPSTIAQEVVSKLIKDGRALSGWIGVVIQPVSDQIAKSLAMKRAYGAMVNDVAPSGPADKAGLKSGDVILEFNGVEIKDSTALPALVARLQVGQSVPMIVLREREKLPLKIVIGDHDEAIKKGLAQSENEGMKKGTASKKLLGIAVETLTPNLRDRYRISSDIKGVVIVDVDGDSEAYENGLRPGMVIQQVTIQGHRTYLDTQSTFEKVISEALGKGDAYILFAIPHGKMTRYVTLSSKKKP